MKPHLTYTDIPANYIHCLNQACPRSSECMRFRAGTLADQSVKHFKTVNPAYVGSTEDCPLFHPEQIIRYALGISRLYEDLPHAKYLEVKKAIHSHFGHNKYYQIYNQERFISPKDQDFIGELFRKEGIDTPPVFDQYIERYDFTPGKE